jgi:predicted MFS family arabinose efflux permease
MSGLLIGILSARTISGLLSGLGGWQTVYRVVAGVMVLAAVALWRALPAVPGRPGQRWGATVASLAGVARAFPRLRTRALLGGLTFAGASLVLSTMSLLLTGPPFGLDDAEIGLVSLVGVAGALLANFVGRAVDRGWSRQVNIACLAALFLAWLLFTSLGAHLLVAFVLAMVLLDMGLQGVHVSNHAIVQGLSDTARTRVTSVYMTGYFLGGATGSIVASLLWHIAAWPAVCAAGFVFLALTVAALRLDARTDAPDETPAHSPRPIH